MRNTRFIIVFVCLISLFAKAQTEVPKDYFTNPLDIPLVLSGTFGELRSNHFHSGLDIKTQRKTGLRVKAAATGTVSRIKISHYGYGKALYITHPNGYTTVYAHLNKFSPEIEAYVKKQQYKKEDFEIELFPKAGLLDVSQGEIIAFSGNTGGSGGPHLHFEIRDKNSRPMNPMLFGIEIKDTRKPLVNRVRAYPLEESAQINGSENPVELRLTQKANGDYIAEGINAIGRIGFGVSTVDQQNLANNKNGIYSITSQLNGNVNFELNMNRFSFAETRYLNRMIDYPFWIKNKSRVQKLFLEKNNPLSIYGQMIDNGEVWVEDSLHYQYAISIKDFKNNEVKIHIPITGKRDSITQLKINKATDHYVYADQSYTFQEGKYEVYIPKGALYDDAFLDIKVDGDILNLHKKEIPVHKNIIISYDLSKYTGEDREKLYLGWIDYKKNVRYTGARIKDNKLTAGTRTLGDYSIGLDKDKPIITPKNVTNGKWMSKYRYLKFEIEDTNSGISGYRATVNGKYILMEYDYKTKSLVHDFNDNVVTDTENNFKLIVTDNVGNSTTFETTFFRKNKVLEK